MGAQWKRTVRFRELLDGGDSPEEAKSVGRLIAGRVSAAIPESDVLRDDELSFIIARLQDDVADVDDLNGLLEELYDWGDLRHRLFLEL